MRRRKKMSKMWTAIMLTAAVTVWMAGTGVVRAATVDDDFIVGGETVHVSLAGDANSVTGKTSYTQGTGVVEVTVSGQAKAPGDLRVTGVVSMPPAVNTPGGASGTITPPAGKVLISAQSHHYATINGQSKDYNLKLF